MNRCQRQYQPCFNEAAANSLRIRFPGNAVNVTLLRFNEAAANSLRIHMAKARAAVLAYTLQ